MARRRPTPLIPRLLALASVSSLIVSYIPLTGLDHLHLHISEGFEFVHDHVHVGHHEHDHHHHHHRHHHHHDTGVPTGAPDDGSDEQPPSPTAVVSFAQAAQLRPPAVKLPATGSPVEPEPPLSDQRAPESGWIYPSDQPRAPPARA